MFYQAITSSYCACYALGNLLSLYRRDVNRKELYDLFGYPRSFRNEISHDDLLRIIRRCFPHNILHWTTPKRFSTERLFGLLDRLGTDAVPTLLTLRIRHPRKKWTGLHCVVIVGMDKSGVHIMDLLGRRDGGCPNATITYNECTLGWHVRGAPILVTAGPMSLIKGLPPSPLREV